MSSYVIACYVITVASIGGYAAWTISRYRAVTKSPTKWPAAQEAKQ